ncbi:MAG TPA: CBS domain-containing protein [Anaerolineales bacterium]|nr:CBS domain-containing protein [Anaerolineales bacterium]
MNISDCMKRNVISISETATVREAAAIVAEKHIGLLPIVDNDMKVIGVVGLKDLLSLELPDFIRFIADVDFVHDFGAVETTRPPSEVLDKPITSLMKSAIMVDEECGLMRAYALILQHNLHDMPVVSKSGKLVGIASRVDIGKVILSAWESVE